MLAERLLRRICLLFGEPQRFGTHVFRDQQGRLLVAATADPDGLAERRRSMNMPPLPPEIPLERRSRLAMRALLH